MENLKETLKRQIVEALNLEGVAPESIGDDTPLFGEGLGLDSIDALELIVILDKNYGIRLADPSEGKEVFRSISTIAGYVESHRTK